tara:strand:+ start:11016 stop:11384 length:369 start_codon:yes stop_codon:yes gene_type:complete
MKKLNILLSTLILSFTFNVTAIEATEMSKPAEKEALQMDVSDQKIKDFAQTLKSLQSISTAYKSKLEGLEDMEKMREIQLQAQKEMKKKIEDSPFTLQEYVSLSKYLRQNENFKNRVAKELK